MVVGRGVGEAVISGVGVVTGMMDPAPPFINTDAPMTTAMTTMMMRAAAINNGFFDDRLTAGGRGGGTGVPAGMPDGEGIATFSGAGAPVWPDIGAADAGTAAGTCSSVFPTRMVENIARFFCTESSSSAASDGKTEDCAGVFSAGVTWVGCRDGTRGEGWVRGFESSINGSIEWITSSIGRSLWIAMGLITGGIGTETWGTDDSGAGAGSPTGRVAGDSVRVPQRLQNAESGGTRLPHREQNDPCGREEVSTGFCGV
jgi:hypothetical protein